MKDLENKLKDHGYDNVNSFIKQDIIADNISVLKLRDRLCEIGTIIEEDFDKRIYVVIIRPTFFSRSVIVAVKLNNKRVYMCGCCISGKNRKGSVQSAFSLVDRTINKKQSVNKTGRKTIIAVITTVLVFIFVATCVINTFAISRATRTYNINAEKYNKTVTTYNELTGKGDFSAIEDMPEKLERLDIQKTDFLSCLRALFSFNSASKIEKDTETIEEMENENKIMIKICRQLISPSQNFVVQRLKRVKLIDKTEAVTKENDANGMLGKENGYNSCVYYSTSLFNNTDVPGKSIIDKGTDGGGAVEIFSNLSSARERVDYLSSFDGTILATGSYTLVGTMIIRTSCFLETEDQIKVADSIINALTMLDNK